MSSDYISFISIKQDQSANIIGARIPIISQQQRTFRISNVDTKYITWSQCLKKAVINFIWMYVVGIIAFCITLLSVSAHGSFLRKHFTTSMVLILFISVTCSFIFTVSMIRCRQTCEKLVPPPEDDEDGEHFVDKNSLLIYSMIFVFEFLGTNLLRLITDRCGFLG